MADLAISFNTVIVNGQIIKLAKRPKFTLGNPTRDVMTTQVGNQTHLVISEDYSEAVGKVTLTLANTPETLELVRGWYANYGKNSIRLVDEKTGQTLTFNKMTVVEDTEFDMDSENTDVNFEGGGGV